MYLRLKIGIKKTIDLSNILDRNCHLRMLEMVIQSIKISKLLGEHALFKDPLVGYCLGVA